MLLDISQIEVKLARATTLPILPNVVVQVLALTENYETSARDYERLIVQDAALTTKILRTANTAYFNTGSSITSIQRALGKLGSNTIRSICMAVSFHSALSSKSLDHRFQASHFWKHSLAVACGAKILAVLKHSPLCEEAFVAGLMHDIGKLALCLFLPTEYAALASAMNRIPTSQYEVEESLFGLTHQEIGSLAAQRWGLPDLYHAPIARHHTPVDAAGDIDPLTAFVHMGNVLAYETDFGFAPAGQANLADPAVLDYLEIAEPQLELIRAALAHEVAKISAQMGL